MKKFIKIFFIILAILLIFIIADTIQAKIFDNNPLIRIRFNKDGGNVDSEGNNLKYKKLEDVELDYDLAQMVEDKCYIVLKSNKTNNRDVLDKFIIYNIEELDNFIKNVESKKSDEIRIVEYTPDEQQPILTNLQYKDNKFIMQIDNRRDGVARQEDKKIVTTEYDSSEYVLSEGEEHSNESNTQKSHELILKSNKSNITVFICNYFEVEKDDEQKFQIQFNKNLNGEEKTKILGKDETDKYDYDIYSYKGTVDIIINNKKMTLRDALLKDEVTIDEILEKADKDVNDLKIYMAYYLDGGSRCYLYEDYSILKFHTLEGNHDLYFGVPSMNINDVE